jgi:ABC-type transporter Mla MlaB component
LIGLTLAFFLTDAGPEMTLRMERFSAKRGTRIRLSGELRNEQLNDLQTEIERGGPQVTLDLDELNLVDIDAVRFLNAWVDQGVKVVNCSRYIREWMYREQKHKQSGDEA